MSEVVTNAVFGREQMATFWDDAKPLLEKHWREIATYPDIVLEPDLQRYLNIEETGLMRIFTARFNNTLVGYAVFFAAPALHYKSSLQAIGDVIFVDPEWRRGRLAWNLLNFAHNELEGEGVEVIYHHVKMRHPALAQLLTRMGFTLDEYNYSKRLG